MNKFNLFFCYTTLIIIVFDYYASVSHYAKWPGGRFLYLYVWIFQGLFSTLCCGGTRELEGGCKHIVFKDQARKSGAYPSEAPFRSWSLGYAPGLPHKHKTRLERHARDKHSSLLRKSVNYGHEKFYSIGPRCRKVKNYFYFHPNLIFLGKTPNLSGAYYDYHLQGQAPALFANLKLGWKRLTLRNTPAY
jgi:hypothetical protein